MNARTIASLLTAGTLLLPASAEAHVSIHPNSVPAGAFATLDVRVPGEQQGAHVTRLDMLFPPGFTSVAYENVPGWSARVIESKLGTPLHEDGETIDTEVSQIVWTWSGPLGEVEDGQFIELPLSLAIPAGAGGRPLEFKTVQTYSGGQAVHWIEPSLSDEHPSPRIDVTARGGVIEDLAGAEAGPQPGQTGPPQGATPLPAARRAASGGASEGLALAALLVGCLALLAGLGALYRGSARSRFQ